MASTAARLQQDPEGLPLIGANGPGDVVAHVRGVSVDAAQFLADVQLTASALPEAAHVLNVCADRYVFAVVLCAAVVRGKLTLLPPSTTPNVVAALRAFAPDAIYVADNAVTRLELPRCEPPSLPARIGGDFEMPWIAAGQAVACVFTSGSTGEPQPNFKTWGALVRDVQGEAKRLGIGRGHAVLGTVPPQHMYGFESTVLLPLVSGATLTCERPYFPADINSAIEQLRAPRTLFITPFHLRTWLESGQCARIEALVCATAPLSPALAREAEERTGARLLEIYGCTESGQIATRRTAHSAEWEAFDGVRVWNEGAQAMVAGGHVTQPTALQDMIEVLGDGRRFLLHGRNADMVNVAGKRNSLSYLTHQLLSIPGVRDGIFHFPSQEPSDGVGRLMAFAVAPGLDARSIVAALRERIDSAFLPRPLVLVERLPREATGKITRASLDALAANARSQAHTPQMIETTVRIAADHPAFDGHFPGEPVVPGVILIAEVMAAVEASMARPAPSWRLVNVKFLRALHGECELSIRHERLAAGGVRFEIRCAGELVAAGQLAHA